ncbi:hypothetical protein B7C51_24895 (plasmid) [Paenibacillus larvae subsp. pulvifaciens]|uniref:Uncharacterized protein n=1 Tax=Paenibacillus larvae subsp. pulvifaciens TaxID=1477 RepID=A0A1V0UZU3_9BACL|nr:AAA family ATPase [Paenibacillus larvae]ARF70714.1 hypothetical protein B7C51_24895 [Paenibacillus larvae subsp. pulvifaciens]
MAIDLFNLSINEPKAALEDYFWVISGIPKSGKTSLFAKVCEKYFGGVENSLLIAFEKGYQALRVKAVDVNKWSDFEEMIKILVENKNKLGIKFIGLDTADVMWDMATEDVIREWNRKNPQKRTNDIVGVGARGTSNQGFGVGYQLVKKKVRNAIDKLMKAGYGIMALTHSKDKKVEEKNGSSYDQLVLSLSSSGSEVFVNMADFIVFITIEKEDIDDVKVTKRYMYFRSDDYITAGSRFQNLPTRIEYNIDEFLRVFEDAVKAEFDKGVDLETIKSEQRKRREEDANDFIESLQKTSDKDMLISRIDEEIKKTNDKDTIKKILKKSLGTIKYAKIDDVELLEKVLEDIKEINEQ